MEHMRKPVFPVTLELSLTPEQEASIIPQLNLEEEFRAGTREQLSDGRACLICQINDQVKYDKVFAFLIRTMAENEQPITQN